MYKDIEIIKGEIKYLLESLHDQFESIDSQDDKIMQIDVDLFKNYVVNLYEATLRMKRYNLKEEVAIVKQVNTVQENPINEESVPIRFSIISENQAEIETSKEIEPTQAIQSPEVKIIEPINKVEEQEEIQLEELIKPSQVEIPQVIFEEEIPIIEKSPEPQPQIQKEEKQEPIQELLLPDIEAEIPKPKVKKTTLDLFAEEPQTLADKFKTEKKALNELLHTEQKNVAGKIPKKPINDLKQAIGINEKFNFINELFKGSLQDYNVAINELNNAQNWELAQELLSILSQKYNWAENLEASNKFGDLIIRKFL